MIKKILIASFVFAVITTSAYVLLPLISRDYVIIVNEEKISSEEFQQELEKMTSLQENRDEDLLRRELAERIVERLIFSSYLKSLQIEVTQEEIDAKYQFIAENTPDIENGKMLREQWGKEGADLYILDKQFIEEIAYDKIFTAYLQQEDISLQEGDEIYDKYLQEDADWEQLNKDEFIQQVKYQLVYERIEGERKDFEQSAKIEIKL